MPINECNLRVAPVPESLAANVNGPEGELLNIERSAHEFVRAGLPPAIAKHRALAGSPALMDRHASADANPPDLAEQGLGSKEAGVVVISREWVAAVGGALVAIGALVHVTWVICHCPERPRPHELI